MNIHLRIYSNQFRQYYIKFAKYMKDISNGKILYQIDDIVKPEDVSQPQVLAFSELSTSTDRRSPSDANIIPVDQQNNDALFAPQTLIQ